VIIDLPSTNSSTINRSLVDLREKGGSVTLGRVLTLVIVTEEPDTEDPIAAANAASFEHPCRVIVVARGARRAAPRMDAQIRVGGDAGASEVVVLRLYGSLVDHGASVVVPLLLADAPVVAWWPGEAPEVPADDPIGALATRRITDTAAARRPIAQLNKQVASYRPGDTDLSWTRITRWRGLLAATLDQPPHEKVVAASVAGAADSPSAELLAGWLALALRCPVRRIKSPAKSGPGLHSVVLTRRAGDISLVRPQSITAELKVTNQPERHVALPRRGLRDCLAEELRRLDADEVYEEVLSRGLALVAKQASAEPARTAVTTSRRSGSAAQAAKAGPARTRKVLSKGTGKAVAERNPAATTAPDTAVASDVGSAEPAAAAYGSSSGRTTRRPRDSGAATSTRRTAVAAGQAGSATSSNGSASTAAGGTEAASAQRVTGRRRRARPSGSS